MITETKLEIMMLIKWYKSIMKRIPSNNNKIKRYSILY